MLRLVHSRVHHFVHALLATLELAHGYDHRAAGLGGTRFAEGGAVHIQKPADDLGLDFPFVHAGVAVDGQIAEAKLGLVELGLRGQGDDEGGKDENFFHEMGVGLNS